MIRRLVGGVMGVVGALSAAQLPEFSQQYYQRLGGALDEVRAIVRQFDEQAAALRLSREDALARLRANPDALVVGRGLAMQDSVRREAQLQRQRAAMEGASAGLRSLAMVRDFDAQVARGALDDFRPAVPLSLEAALFAIAGFMMAALLTGLLLLPGRAVSRRPPAGRDAAIRLKP